MKTLDQYADKFGSPAIVWTIERWREVATELASWKDACDEANAQDNPRAQPTPAPAKRRGRPASVKGFASAAVNYQALAYQVEQRMEQARKAGKNLTLKAAVRQEMLASVARRNDNGIPTRASIVDAKLETAYTEVRKLAAKRKSGD